MLSNNTTRRLFDSAFLARLESLYLISKRLAGRQGAGVRASRRMGDGLEFADHRDYTPGDEIRFLDWAYYARMEKLLVRLFHEHSESDVVLMVDTSASMCPAGDRSKSDYALKAAGALAYVAMGNFDRVHLVGFSDGPGASMHTGRNRKQIFQVLDFLVGLETGGRTQLAESARKLAGRIRPGSTVILLSDLLDCQEEMDDALKRLSIGGNSVTVLHVYSPADCGLEFTGPAVLTDAETGRQLSVDIDLRLAEEYRKAWGRFQDGCQRTCIARGAAYAAACCDMPFERLILATLRKAGVLAG